MWYLCWTSLFGKPEITRGTFVLRNFTWNISLNSDFYKGKSVKGSLVNAFGWLTHSSILQARWKSPHACALSIVQSRAVYAWIPRVQFSSNSASSHSSHRRSEGHLESLRIGRCRQTWEWRYLYCWRISEGPVVSRSLGRRECRLGLALRQESGTCEKESRECITKLIPNKAQKKIGPQCIHLSLQ